MLLIVTTYGVEEALNAREKEETMDYEGQKLAEHIFYWIILSFGIVGWVIGYVQQDFTVVFQAWLAGVVLSVIVSSHYSVYRFQCRSSFFYHQTNAPAIF